MPSQHDWSSKPGPPQVWPSATHTLVSTSGAVGLCPALANATLPFAAAGAAPPSSAMAPTRSTQYCWPPCPLTSLHVRPPQHDIVLQPAQPQISPRALHWLSLTHCRLCVPIKCRSHFMPLQHLWPCKPGPPQVWPSATHTLVSTNGAVGLCSALSDATLAFAAAGAAPPSSAMAPTRSTQYCWPPCRLTSPHVRPPQHDTVLQPAQ